MKLINRLFIILISCLLSSVALAKDLTVGLKSEHHLNNLKNQTSINQKVY